MGMERFFEHYAPVADQWLIVDNSTHRLRLVAYGERNGARLVRLPEIYGQITKPACFEVTGTTAHRLPPGLEALTRKEMASGVFAAVAELRRTGLPVETEANVRERDEDDEDAHDEADVRDIAEDDGDAREE